MYLHKIFTKKSFLSGGIHQSKNELKIANRYLLVVFNFPKTEQQCIPSRIYLLKVTNKNTRTRRKICSKLTIKTPERCQWLCSGVFFVNFEHILHRSSVSIINFDHVIVSSLNSYQTNVM